MNKRCRYSIWEPRSRGEALLVAIKRKTTQKVQELLGKPGASKFIDHQDEEGSAALIIASRNGHTQTVTALLAGVLYYLLAQQGKEKKPGLRQVNYTNVYGN